MMFNKIAFLFLFSLNFSSLFAQNTTVAANYSDPQVYILDSVFVSGVQYLDADILANMSGLNPGDKITIPSDEITKILKKYWEQGLFEDVKIIAQNVKDGHATLEIKLLERPRLMKLTIEGVKKGDIDDLKEKLNMRPGSQLTDNVISNLRNIIRKFYVEKGYFNIVINIEQTPDTAYKNRINLKVIINKNKRVKIKNVFFSGNVNFKDNKLRGVLKKTKQRDWKFWNTSKYIEKDYKDDKQLLIDFYNEKGFRDAKILSDSIQVLNKKRINIYFNLFEGRKYFFRNITWVGNTKYPSEYLSILLGIKKGDVFDQKTLDKRLTSDDDAVSSLYLDNGYLFFQVTPVEVLIQGDSIDFEMRMYEGKQATLNEIIISGNTKTNEHVVRREIRTLPGELFSRRDIIRTVRELATLGHFEPEKIEPNPIPDQANGTADIEYKLVEKANDQLEISGGYGGYVGFIGTIGVRFSNFSARNFFNKSAWRPIPSGDGQTLSLRFQASGAIYQSFNTTFIEPWWGGKKPNSLSVSARYSKYSNVGYYAISAPDTSNMRTIGGSIGLGRRLLWPDDYFILQNEIGYEVYILRNMNLFGFSNGECHNLNFTTTISRNSVDQPIYPRSGSLYSLRIMLTPPYSLINGKDLSGLSRSDRLKESNRMVEYHKWVFKTEWYNRIVGNLVLATKANFGFLNRYNSSRDYSAFEKFDLGVETFQSFSYYNVDFIQLRGYTDGTVTPRENQYGQLVRQSGADGAVTKVGNVYNKFTMELRYPIALKEQATLYVLGFAEGGNAWDNAGKFNPTDLKRSVGIGLRAFLPMFGLLGIDYGIPFDDVPGLAPGASKSGNFHFTLGQQF